MLAELERAVKSRDEAWVKRILEKEPRLDSEESGRILWLAVLDDELEIASTLVRAGADLKARRPGSALGESLLHFLGGSLDPRHRRLGLLTLDHGADVEARDKRATSVLSRVIEAKLADDVDLVGELLLRGARVDAEELRDAAEHPNAAELLPLLLQLGFYDDESRLERAEFALYFACDVNVSESKSLAAAKALLDLKLPLRKYSTPVVEALFRAVGGDKREVARLILDRVGVDVNVKSTCGARSLHYACQFASLEMMELLLRRGADYDVVDDFGGIPFSRIPDPLRLSDKSRLGIKHLAESAVKGRAIDERGRAIIEKSAEMKTFYDDCLEELRTMRLTFFFNSFTFFDVLASDVRRLSFLARNRDFVESFKGYPRERKFPIFCGDLEKVFDDAESRKERLLEKEVALREELFNVLPYVPLQKIVFYLYLNEEIDLKD